jgi:N-sulfoglucosamine sulfohydrolase
VSLQQPDVSPAVRDDRWLYLRNFMPHLSWMQPEGYSDASTFRQEFKRLAADGQLGPGPLTYAAPRRAVEELYDTWSDPHQIRNLVNASEYRAVLDRFRAELRRWQLATRDAGYLTEPQMWSRLGAQGTPWTVAREETLYPLNRLLDAADAVGREDASAAQRAGLRDADDGVRYWSAVGLNARLSLNAADRQALREALRDPSPVVRIEAAAALARHDEPDAALPVLIAALEADAMEVALHAARALELLGARSEAAVAAMQAGLARARTAEAGGHTIAMFIRFSLEAALRP